jgi:hypothetical protein
MVYKFFKVIFLLLFISDSVSPQVNKLYKKDSLTIKDSPIDTLELYSNELNNRQQGLTTLPFSGFMFKDVRPDTNYIGGANRRRTLLSKGYHTLKFTGSTSDALSGFLNDTASYVFTSRNYTLFCFIKQLRLTQIDSMTGTRNAKKQLYTTARLEIEAFLEYHNLYYPALKFDTVAYSYSVRVKDISILRVLLGAFANKSALTDSLSVIKRNGYSYDDIINKYEKRFIEPIITDTVLNKGVYKTVAEFLNNNPSVKYFEFNKEGILYTRLDNSELAPTREAFGFCDGERIWININRSFHPLIKQGKTFEFLADMNLLNKVIQPLNTPYIYHDYNEPIGETIATTAALALAAILIPANYSSQFVYQLDIQTGQFY